MPYLCHNCLQKLSEDDIYCDYKKKSFTLSQLGHMVIDISGSSDLKYWYLRGRGHFLM